jgi:predicted acetyltransferase
MECSALLAGLRRHRLGSGLLPDHVPGTVLYGVVGQTIVGRIWIHHVLNDHLRRVGGHLGHAVAPPFRRRGYATAMVRQGFDACRTLGLRRMLVTASDGNAPSWRIIERLGGVFECMVDDDGDPTRRYWIEV